MRKTTICLLTCLFLIGLSGPSLSTTKDYSKQAALVDKATITLKRYISDPNMTWYRENICSAKAILIIPQLLKGAFFFGAEGGTGVLVAKDEHTGEWSKPAFYTMASASFGIQAGAQSAAIILMIMTDKGMDALLSTSLKLGADASIAAGPYGTGAKAQTVDVLAFSQTSGAFGGISLEGSIITPRDSWNQAYYHKNVRAVDIIIRRNVSAPQSSALIKVITSRCQGKTK